jgi:RNA polymerase sigma-70 factor (ECF subfamily)
MTGAETFNDDLAALLPRLWRYAYVLCRDPDLSHDLVQATCERAISRRHQFRPGTRLDAWTFTILQSIWKNDIRRDSIRRGQGFVAAEDAGLVDREELPDGKIYFAEVLDMVNTLPEAQKSAVYLVYVEGLSYEEAAQALEIPTGTLTSRLVRARLRIADMVRGEPVEISEEKST